MDDLHPDSDDAKTVETLSEDEVDTEKLGVVGGASTDEAASKEDAESGDSAADHPDVADDSDGPDEVVSESESASTLEGSDAPKEAPVATASDVAKEEGAEDVADQAAVTSASPGVPVTSVSEGGVQGATSDEEAAPDISMLETAAPMPHSASQYTKIRELGRDSWGRVLVAWRKNGDGYRANGQGQEPPVVLLERSDLDVEAASRVIEYHLYHARLLAPRAIVHREGNEYWLVVEAPASYEAPFTSIADGGRLDVRSALKAGVGLANALSYLHTNGVSHGHVGPGAMLVHNGRAYLSGVELAAQVETSEVSSAKQFAADVNALARALVQLAGLPKEAAGDEDVPTQAIRAIAAHADAVGFVTAEDLAQECGQALQEPALSLPAVDESAMRPLVFHYGSATTVGLLRSQNQDALGCTVLDVRDDVGRDRPLGIFLVADGMGGEAAGEIASRIGARIAMAELVRQLLVPTVAMPALEPLSPAAVTGATSVATLAQALAIAVDAANRQVRALASSLQESTGTTLTALVAAGGRAVLAHLGDSRAYLLRDGQLVQLTKDHSLLARLTELDHPLLNDPSFGMPRNYLYRSLGQEDEAPPDMIEFPIIPDDRLLLCSDGLWDELDDATIQRCLTSTDDSTECANHLVRLANAAGGHDNSTAVVLFVGAQPDDPVSEFTQEQVDAILRATGALEDDEEDDEEGDAEDNGGLSDDGGIVNNMFDMETN